MKKIVFGFLMTFSVLQSQNNLIYNEAKFVQIDDNTPVVVPDGKVWKIESYSNGVGANRAGTLNINGQDYVLTLDSPNSGVIWAPAGSSITGGPSSNTGSMSPINVINVIEFNVVPTSTGSGSGTGGGGVSSDGLIFSQVINEAVTTQYTTTSGTVIYSFQVPSGHIWKMKYMRIQYWNSNINTFQGSLIGGAIYITKNDEGPFISQAISSNASDDSTVLLKEGNYQVKYFQNNSNGGSGNRFYLEAIEYRIP